MIQKKINMSTHKNKYFKKILYIFLKNIQKSRSGKLFE